MDSVVKILVLDDQPEIREIISDIIEMNIDLIEIDEAQNYFEAMELVNNNMYNLLVVDIYLGGKSGLEFIKDVRTSEGSNKDTHIFVITGSVKGIRADIEKFDNIDLFSKVEGIESLTTKITEVLNI